MSDLHGSDGWLRNEVYSVYSGIALDPDVDGIEAQISRNRYLEQDAILLDWRDVSCVTICTTSGVRSRYKPLYETSIGVLCEYPETLTEDGEPEFEIVVGSLFTTRPDMFVHADSAPPFTLSIDRLAANTQKLTEDYYGDAPYLLVRNQICPGAFLLTAQTLTMSEVSACIGAEILTTADVLRRFVIDVEGQRFERYVPVHAVLYGEPTLRALARTTDGKKRTVGLPNNSVAWSMSSPEKE